MRPYLKNAKEIKKKYKRLHEETFFSLQFQSWAVTPVIKEVAKEVKKIRSTHFNSAYSLRKIMGFILTFWCMHKKDIDHITNTPSLWSVSRWALWREAIMLFEFSFFYHGTLNTWLFCKRKEILCYKRWKCILLFTNICLAVYRRRQEWPLSSSIQCCMQHTRRKHGELKAQVQSSSFRCGT